MMCETIVDVVSQSLNVFDLSNQCRWWTEDVSAAEPCALSGGA
jgi:hypothetical protein